MKKIATTILPLLLLCTPVLAVPTSIIKAQLFTQGYDDYSIEKVQCNHLSNRINCAVSIVSDRNHVVKFSLPRKPDILDWATTYCNSSNISPFVCLREGISFKEIPDGYDNQLVDLLLTEARINGLFYKYVNQRNMHIPQQTRREFVEWCGQHMEVIDQYTKDQKALILRTHIRPTRSNIILQKWINNPE